MYVVNVASVLAIERPGAGVGPLQASVSVKWSETWKRREWGASYRVDARLALEHAENGGFEVVDGEGLSISFDCGRPSLSETKEEQGQQQIISSEKRREIQI